MDRRIKYTKKIIKDTFLKLLAEKDINKITVSEICKIADINRATFYRYYLDVYDLLDKIQEEFVNELKNAVNTTDNLNIQSFTQNMLNIFLENKELAKLLFNTTNNVFLLNDILEVAYEKCKKRWLEDLPNLSEHDIEYATVFIFNGALGIVNYWIKNDFDKDVNEISEIINNLSSYGTKRFIYKK